VFASEYHFVTVWRVEGGLAEVAEVLADAEDLVRWWPSVYLDVDEIEPGDADGVGKLVQLHTKGWLPYTLRWEFRVTESNHPYGWTLEASGDFAGTGIWRLRQDGPEVEATYDWRIRADKPLLRYLGPLLRPAFAANHRWAMAQGEQSLRLELARRAASTPEALAQVPPPPAATTTSPLPVFAATAAVAVGAVALLAGLRRALVAARHA
jgi:hypothetical protein